MLHIVNGGSTEQTLRQTPLSGEFFSFRDALINGPTPRTTNAAAWRRLRAEHLSTGYGTDLQHCETELAEQEKVPQFLFFPRRSRFVVRARCLLPVESAVPARLVQ